LSWLLWIILGAAAVLLAFCVWLIFPRGS